MWPTRTNLFVTAGPQSSTFSINALNLDKKWKLLVAQRSNADNVIAAVFCECFWHVHVYLQSKIDTLQIINVHRVWRILIVTTNWSKKPVRFVTVGKRLFPLYHDRVFCTKRRSEVKTNLIATPALRFRSNKPRVFKAFWTYGVHPKIVLVLSKIWLKV